MQKKTVSELKGYVCEGFKTVEVSYCGAYSHTKQTGESTFNVPIVFTQIECLAMVSSKSYVTNTMSYPLILNSMNSIKIYTHGAVTYTSNNIHCTGESLRLESGEINSNMTRQEHIIISMRKLIEIDGNVIDPIIQVKLAQTQNEMQEQAQKHSFGTTPENNVSLMKVRRKRPQTKMGST